jgi:outer membrane protein
MLKALGPTGAWRAAPVRLFLAALIVFSLTGLPRVLAADVTDIGYLDQGALATIPAFADANRKFTDFRSSLQREFEGRSRRARTQDDQNKLAAEFQSRLAARQRELFSPLFAAAQTAVASIASSRALSIVVDKRIVIVGGQDITKNVVDLLSSPGSPVPPVNTPPPSTVGWVDQTQIDSLDQFKKAQDDFAKFGEDQRKSAQDKLRGAKTDADRNKIYADYQKAIDDKRDQQVKPLVDTTRAAIADVARKKGLVLVIDRNNLIFGGTDVTQDVVAALKK